MSDNKPKSQAEKDFDKIRENIFIESGHMFGEDPEGSQRIILLEEALLKALQERDQWKEAAAKHQKNSLS